MRSYQQIEAALERAANSVKEAECLVHKRNEEVARLGKLLRKAELKETGIVIKIAKCEVENKDVDFWRQTFDVETTEGFIFGSGTKYRVGGSYKISASFYRQIKLSKIQNDKRKEQGYVKCSNCGSEKVYAICDRIECMDCRRELAQWNVEKQCWVGGQ